MAINKVITSVTRTGRSATAPAEARLLMLVSPVIASKLLLTGLTIQILFAPGAALAQPLDSRHLSPVQQEEAFFSPRAGRTGIPQGAYLTALAQRSAMPMNQAAAQGAWMPLGPAPIANGYQNSATSGRVTAIAADRTDPNTLYVGGAQGGLWKSTDGGQSWTPLTDSQPSLAIGSITIDPTNRNVIYVGTGEPNVSCDSYYGAGVLKSTDGGASWTQLGASLFTGATIHRILVDPTNANTVYLTAFFGSTSSATGACGSPNANTGIYKSTNGGNTWTRILEGFPSDLVMDPSNSQTLYAANWGTSLVNWGVYKSINGGATWVPALLNTLFDYRTYDRVSLAVAPSSPSTVYASIGDYCTAFECAQPPDPPLQLTLQSTDAGTNWSRLPALPAPGAGFRQWAYTSLLAVDPNDPSTIYVGDTELYKFSGGAWTDVAGYDHSNIVHVDMHALEFAPGSSATFYLGSDGGVYETTDGATTDPGWINLNTNLAITQFQSIAVHPTSAQTVIGGTQDNGTLLYSGTPSWTQIRGGDGGGTLIDQANPTTFYHTFPFLSPERSDDGGQTWNDISFFIVDVCSTFYPPLAMDPANSSVIGIGGTGLWLSGDRGNSWLFYSLPDPPQFGTCSVGGFSKVTAIGLASNLARLYVGREDGGGVVTTTDGFFWAYANSGLPPSLPFITDLVVLANDPNSAYLTTSGFGGAHVFRTTNAGASWQNITGNLPNTPANSIAVDPSSPATHLFVGTDVGVFETTDSGTTWSRAGIGLPNVSVFMVRLQSSTGTLFAATHGRGAFALAGAVLPAGSQSVRLQPARITRLRGQPHPRRRLSGAITFGSISAASQQTVGKR